MLQLIFFNLIFMIFSLMFYISETNIEFSIVKSIILNYEILLNEFKNPFN